METKKSFSAQYVDDLLNEGAKVLCDETSETFNNHNDLPPFYDENLFKKGQQFLYKHLFALFFSKCMGLLVVLSVPSILKILMFTKMSSTCMTAYRRYLSTIFHMMVWYDSDFKPGSRLWRSIADVRNRHNSASRRSGSAGFAGISQKDMALTQFGFMGFALARSELVGVHNATEEEWKAFVHIWRVIGYLMGIEDRFNICSGTVQQTREICSLLIDQTFQPYVEEKNPDFLTMASYMLNGLWSMSPVLKCKSILCYLHILLQTNNNNELVKPTYMKLNMAETINFYIYLYSAYMLRWNWYRIYQNYTKIVSLWLMKYFPFLAYYQHGFGNSYVFILDDNKNK